MSGLEVVGLVSGIVAAFASGASYFQDRKERKKRKAEKTKDRRQELAQLQTTVSSAPHLIQHEYNEYFARIGSRFAVGDSIARGQLNSILQKISTLEQQLRSASSATRVDYSSILGLSRASRAESVTALAEQYQRLCAAAPITRTPTYPALKLPYYMSQYLLPTPHDENSGHEALPTLDTLSEDVSLSTYSPAPQKVRSLASTENPSHIDTSIVTEDIQEDAVAPIYSRRSSSVDTVSSDEPGPSISTTPSEDAQISVPTVISTTSLATSACTNDNSSSQDLVPEKASESNTVVETLCSIAQKATTTSENATSLCRHLTGSSPNARPDDAAFVQFLTARLNESAETLARDAKNLVQMTDALSPDELHASSKAQWCMALLEDDIAAANKRMAYGERLMFGPKESDMTDYTSSDQKYWLAMNFEYW